MKNKSNHRNQENLTCSKKVSAYAFLLAIFVVNLFVCQTDAKCASPDPWRSLQNPGVAQKSNRFGDRDEHATCRNFFSNPNSPLYYASYGSNLNLDRLRLYIEGGRIQGLHRPQQGARDKTPPRASVAALYPGRLFFGTPFAGSWGYGGVAFFSAEEHGSDKTQALLRLYRVTVGQLEDIVLQENDRDVNDDKARAQLALTGEKICRLLNESKRNPKASYDMRLGGLYDHLLVVAEHDGLPVVTFTCSPQQRIDYATSLRNGCNNPAPAYRRTIAAGLRACGQSQPWIERYLRAAACKRLD